MTKYNKLWTALGMACAFIVLKHYDLVPDGLGPLAVDMIGGALTAAGVYAVPNSE